MIFQIEILVAVGYSNIDEMNNDRWQLILYDIIWYVRYMSKLYLLCPKNDITVYICWRRKKVALGYLNVRGAGLFKFVGARSWGPAFLLVDCCCFEYNLGIKNLQHNPFHSKSICTIESENYNDTLQAQLSCCVSIDMLVHCQYSGDDLEQVMQAVES